MEKSRNFLSQIIELFNHTVEADATVEGELDVTEGDTLTLVLGLDTILGNTIFLDKETLNLVGTLLGELHVVAVAASVVGKTNHENLHIGVVLQDASNGLNFEHLVVGDVPLINIVLDREGHSVEGELVSLDLVDNGLEAVGSGAVATLATLSKSLGKLILKFGNAVLKFSLIVAGVTELILLDGHLAVQGSKVLLSQHSLLSGNGLIGSGNTEAVEVTETEDTVGVVQGVGEELAGRRSVTVDVITIFDKNVVALTEAIAGSNTTVENDTHGTIVGLGNGRFLVRVATESKTTTGEEVEIESTVGVITEERVVDRPQEVEGEGHVTVIVPTIATLQRSPEAGEAEADTPIESVVKLLLGENVHTSIGSLAPATQVAAGIHEGLIVEVNGETNRPIAPETIARILSFAGVLSKGADRSHHKGHHNAHLD